MSLTQDQVRSMDAVRNRLKQLNETLANISRQLLERDPLPTWPQMQELQSALSYALGQLNETMTANAQLLKEAHVYPLTNFPGHKQGETLHHLLRKKMDVRAEEWIAEYTDGYQKKNDGAGVDAGLGPGGFGELWSWATECSQGVVAPMIENEDFADDFTLQEREDGVENVRTGLRRKLLDEESGNDDDGEDGEKMEEDVMPEKEESEEGVDSKLAPLPLDAVLRFMTTGAMPTRPANR